MQILGAVLGLFLGPRGCLGMLLFIAVEILVSARLGGNAPAWAALAMLIIAFLPIGMRNGRAGMMRVFQVVLAVTGASSALLAFIGFVFKGFSDGRAWMSALTAAGCYFGFRGVERIIARTDAAAAATEAARSVL